MATLKLMRKLKSAFRYGCKSHLYLARYLELRKEELQVIRAGKLSKRGPKKVFNLDLHIGVIPDIAEELNIQGVVTTSWSISLSNALVDGRRPIPDPVRHINSRKWHLLDKERIRNFQKRYGKFLANFDGFVCTYPPTFAELFENLNKPVLVLSATRYETPYSESPQAWHRFNSHLVSGVKSGQISLYSNNKGDSDYLNFFTGLTAPISPSLCRKTLSQKGTNGKRIIISKDERLADKFEKETQGLYRKISSLGSPYSWSDLASCEEILVLPQNISTMTLFELATAGVPVAVPGPRWIESLIDEGFSILGELTFHQLLNLPVQEYQKSSPVDYLSSDYLDWWLSRADFYNNDLMPNIRVVNDIEELIIGETKRLTIGDAYSKVIAERNMKIETTRRDMVRHFIEKM